MLTRTLFERRALLPAEGGSVPVLRISVAARRLQHVPAADFFKHPMVCARDMAQMCFTFA